MIIFINYDSFVPYYQLIFCRNCIGQNFATNEELVVVGSILNRFVMLKRYM